MMSFKNTKINCVTVTEKNSLIIKDNKMKGKGFNIKDIVLFEEININDVKKTVGIFVYKYNTISYCRFIQFTENTAIIYNCEKEQKQEKEILLKDIEFLARVYFCIKRG